MCGWKHVVCLEYHFAPVVLHDCADFFSRLLTRGSLYPCSVCRIPEELFMFDDDCVVCIAQ